MFIIFMERLYHHPHFTDREIDPETALAGSWQNWDLKARSLAFSPAFSPIIFQPPRLNSLFRSPENPRLAASCWQGIPSRFLALLLKKGEFQKPRRVDCTQGQSELLFPSLITEGENALHVWGGGDYENQ